MAICAVLLICGFCVAQGNVDQVLLFAAVLRFQVSFITLRMTLCIQVVTLKVCILTWKQQMTLFQLRLLLM